MNERGKKLALALGAVGLSGVLLGAGVLIGFFLEGRSLQRSLQESWQVETMGGIISEDEMGDRSRAYLEPGVVAQRLGGFSWSVPNVPTPFVGSAPRPGRSGNATINSTQFRSARELPARKADGELRIFITGGSTAFGVGAPSQQRTIGAYLEQELNRGADVPRYQIYTLANPSWASTQERILIENRLSEWQPDLVISFSGLNDVHWGSLGRDVLWFRTYQDQLFWSLNDAAHRAFGQGGLVDVQQTSDKPVEPALVASRLEKNLRLARAALSMRQARYLFVLQPSLFATGKPLTGLESSYLEPEKEDYFDGCYGEIRRRLETLGEEGLPVLDLSDVFDQVEADVFIDHYHFGDRGNQLVARRLAPAVRQLVEAP